MSTPDQPTGNSPHNQAYHPVTNPYPQPPKKKHRVWPWVVIGLPVLLFAACTAIVVSSVGGDEEATVTKASGTASADAAPADDSGPDFPGKLDSDTAAAPGDTITRDDLAYTVGPLVAANTDFGNYLCSAVTIKNVGSGQNDFNGYFDWSLQDANGTIQNATFAPEKQLLNSGKIAPGGQTSGDVCFDVREGAGTGTHVVLFEDTFSLSSDRLAWVNTL